jgi:putative ABC transport system permease protein
MLRQIAIVSALGFRGLRSRLWQSLVIVVGMVCVIGVLLSMLSLTEGIAKAFAAGDPRDVLIVPKNAQWEGGNGSIPVSQARIVMTLPGIAKAGDGSPFADTGYLSGVPGISVSGSRDYISVRGTGAKGAALRGVHLTQGRMFRPGTREFIAGERLQARTKNTSLGDKVIMPDGEWTIVGIFNGTIQQERTLLGDTELLMQVMRRNAYHSVLARLESPEAWPAFRRAITGNPALNVDVHQVKAWNARTIADSQKFFAAIIYGISIILGLGALFGCVNTMYAAVESRKQEIATLRALGYGTGAVIVSVLAEAALLCVLGALIGAAIAWGLYDGVQANRGPEGTVLSVSPAMVGIAIGWALLVAFLGGILPSIRAARWTVSEALRAR